MEVENYVLATHGIDDVITKTVGEISSLRQGQGTMAADFAQIFYEKVLQCKNLYPGVPIKMIIC